MAKSSRNVHFFAYEKKNTRLQLANRFEGSLPANAYIYVYCTFLRKMTPQKYGFNDPNFELSFSILCWYQVYVRWYDDNWFLGWVSPFILISSFCSSVSAVHFAFFFSFFLFTFMENLCKSSGFSFHFAFSGILNDKKKVVSYI